jgi:hypothetical protein
MSRLAIEPTMAIRPAGTTDLMTGPAWLGPGQADQPPGQAWAGCPVPTGPECAGEASIEAAAVAAYQASVDIGRPLSERKLAAKFSKTSRRSARHRMADAPQARTSLSYRTSTS